MHSVPKCIDTKPPTYNTSPIVIVFDSIAPSQTVLKTIFFLRSKSKYSCSYIILCFTTWHSGNSQALFFERAIIILLFSLNRISKMSTLGVMNKNAGQDTRIYGLHDNLFRRRIDLKREEVNTFNHNEVVTVFIFHHFIICRRTNYQNISSHFFSGRCSICISERSWFRDKKRFSLAFWPS